MSILLSLYGSHNEVGLTAVMIIDVLFYSVSMSDWVYAWSGNLAMNLIINSEVISQCPNIHFLRLTIAQTL